MALVVLAAAAVVAEDGLLFPSTTMNLPTKKRGFCRIWAAWARKKKPTRKKTILRHDLPAAEVDEDLPLLVVEEGGPRRREEDLLLLVAADPDPAAVVVGEHHHLVMIMMITKMTMTTIDDRPVPEAVVIGEAVVVVAEEEVLLLVGDVPVKLFHMDEADDLPNLVRQPQLLPH